MQRCLVLGSGGAGKTTFSLALSSPTRRRPALLARLGELGPDTAVHVLRGRGEQEGFLAAAREGRAR